MIRTVIGISVLRLWHNRGELLLTFVVPILFFSIFAWIFGSRQTQSAPKLRVVVCDEIRSEQSAQVVAALAASEAFHVQRIRKPARDGSSSTVSRQAAEQLVKRGVVSAAIVLAKHHNLAATRDQSTQLGPGPRIEVLTDSFDLVASQSIVPLVQKVMLLQAAQQYVMPATSGSQSTQKIPRLPLPDGTGVQQAYAEQPPASRFELASTSNIMPASTGTFAATQPIAAAADPLAELRLPEVAVRDVLGAGKANPMVAMYAAGIAVMFLLFSATTGGGSLLEEKENSTLERLLTSRMTMDHLLMGKWCYLTLLGCLQTTLMFVAGAIFFRLDLLNHLAGFTVMTAVTAGAASSFALMLASLCRTRTQLGWVSTILILSMSALGGSMVPRYLMSEQIQRVGQFTFNAWALDGYNKVFWRELPLVELRLELMVLAGCSLIFLIIARCAAARWDRV